MSDVGRKLVHDLVEELPDNELPEIHSLLEERVRRHADATKNIATRQEAMAQIEKTWEGQPSTTPEQVNTWIAQSRP
jgi:hypothetical protein